MRNRTVQLNIRLTEEEYQKLQRSMKKSKLSASAYVRSLIAGHSPKECPTLEFQMLINQLQHVATRLTSLFHLVHLTRQFDKVDVGLLEKEMAQYKQILLTIQAAVMLPEDTKKM